MKLLPEFEYARSACNKLWKDSERGRSDVTDGAYLVIKRFMDVSESVTSLGENSFKMMDLRSIHHPKGGTP